MIYIVAGAIVLVLLLSAPLWAYKAINSDRASLVQWCRDDEAAEVKAPAYAPALAPAASVAVVGVSCALGRRVAEELKRSGVRVVGVDGIRATPRNQQLAAKLCDAYATARLEDAASLREALSGVDGVFHLTAACLGSTADVADLLGSAKATLAAAQAAGVTRLVTLAPAALVYDANARAVAGAGGLTEDQGAATPGDSDVSRAARTAEALVLSEGLQAGGLRTASVRVGSIYGPGGDGVVSTLLQAAMDDRLATAPRAGDVVTDWTFVGNAAHALVMALRALGGEQASDVSGQAFNITDGAPMSFTRFISIVCAAAGHEPPRRRERPAMTWLLSRPPLCWLFAGQKLGRRAPGAPPMSDAKARRFLGYKEVWPRAAAFNLAIQGYPDLRASAATGDPSMPGNGPKRFTRAQVAEHNTAEDAWIIVNRGVYDVSDYVDKHPGGEAIIRNVGGDATKGFFHDGHPEHVPTTLEQFRVGDLADE